MTPRLFEPREVEFALGLFPYETPITGNVLASGDYDADQAAEKWVRDQLEAGNEWAWCVVCVTARWAGFEGDDFSGSVSCESFAAFAKDKKLLESMIDEAVADLLKQITSEGWKIAVFEGSLIEARQRGLYTLLAD